jgi:hypothetical protein
MATATLAVPLEDQGMRSLWPAAMAAFIVHFPALRLEKAQGSSAHFDALTGAAFRVVEFTK